jgi:hypothetical protein
VKETTPIASVSWGNLSPSPAFAFSVACLHARLINDPALAEAAIPADMDWEDFRALAVRHRIAVYVEDLLQNCHRVPAAIRQSLRELAVANQRRAMKKLIELGNVVTSLQDRQVRVLTLKGPVLSWQVHGDIAWRQGGDLDLLVPDEGVLEADELLQQQGYERIIPKPGLSLVREARYRRRCPHFTYVHPGKGTVIELHWRLFSNPAFLPLDFEELYAARETVRIGDISLPAVSDVHRYLHLCCHGAYHGWKRLAWIYDVAVLHQRGIQRQAEVTTMANRFGLGCVIGQASGLCHSLLQTEIPPAFRTACEEDAQVSRLVEAGLRTAMAFERHGPPERWHELAFKLRLASAFRYRRGVIMEDVFQVTRLPFATSPAALLPFYALLRPLFWLQRRSIQKAAMGNE